MDTVTAVTLRTMKARGEKIASLTAYDYSFARLLDQCGVDVVLVGDTLGMVIQGRPTTIPVSMDEMVYHTRCVARGLRRPLLVADLPFMSYQRNPEQALDSAGRLMKEGLAQMVKLEGGEAMAATVRFLVDRGVPVCAHLGLTPQSVHKFGGYRVQGRGEDAAAILKKDAEILMHAGAAALVLEAVPRKLAADITAAVTIPTIGIGAGPECDGQVLVLHDMLGLSGKSAPKFVRDFLADSGTLAGAVGAYVEAVRNGSYPAPEHCYE